MDFPFLLRQEAERWAHLQGLSLEDFILQAVAARVNDLNQRVAKPSEQATQTSNSLAEIPRACFKTFWSFRKP